MRCHQCEPSCVNTRGSVGVTPNEECANECNVDNDMWFCAVEAGECAVMMF